MAGPRWMVLYKGDPQAVTLDPWGWLSERGLSFGRTVAEGWTMRHHVDEVDAGILAERTALFDAVSGPRDGDFVVFADGVMRRVSHVHPEWTDPETGEFFEAKVQTADGGSWHLNGHGRTEFSGTLHRPVPLGSLTQREGVSWRGSVWFFHHGQWRAHNAVVVEIGYRVFDCALEATR